MNDNARLKIALQKGGRLNKSSLTLLKQCGFLFNLNASQLITPCINYPIDLLFVRDDDIPQLVSDGVSDLGIVGENVLYESLGFDTAQSFKMTKLDFCRCRLSIALPKSDAYFGLSSLIDQRIATSYPNLLTSFCDANNISATVKKINGSVELAPAIGMADAICDLVSTGKTLAENNLVEVKTVLKSEAVLIQSTQEKSVSQQRIIKDLLINITRIVMSKRVVEVSA